MSVRVRESYFGLYGLFSKNIWLVVDAGAVRKESLSRSLIVHLIAPTGMVYSALGIIVLSFPVIIVSNRTYVAPAAGRESEFLRTRVATWRSRDLYRTRYPLV